MRGGVEWGEKCAQGVAFLLVRAGERERATLWFQGGVFEVAWCVAGRGGVVPKRALLKARRIFGSLNSSLGSNKENKKKVPLGVSGR